MIPTWRPTLHTSTGYKLTPQEYEFVLANGWIELHSMIIKLEDLKDGVERL